MIFHLECNCSAAVCKFISNFHRMWSWNAACFTYFVGTYCQMVGFNDIIYSVRLLGRADSLLAVATNSKDIKLYEVRAPSAREPRQAKPKHNVIKQTQNKAMLAFRIPPERSLVVKLCRVRPKSKVRKSCRVSPSHKRTACCYMFHLFLMLNLICFLLWCSFFLVSVLA